MQELSVILKPCKGLSKGRHTENNFMQAQINRMKNRIEGKQGDKYKRWDKEAEGK